MKAFLAGTFLLLTVLTVPMTYPQVRGLRDTVHDDGDPLLNTWTLAWVAHQLPRAPARLFDANIFYPERRTLAFSETLLVPGIIAAPLHWAGVGPLLVHNLVFLSGFIISGVGVALLVRHLTASSAAGVLSGIIFAFLPYRIDHYSHLQLQQTQFIPLAMWAFHRLMERGTTRDGVLLGLFVAGQMLSCTYYGIFLLPYMAVVCGVLLASNLAVARRRLAALAIAAAVALIAVVPLGRAHLRARTTVGERPSWEIANGSATWRNYLAPHESNLLYGRTLARFGEAERRLFPGFVAILLAAFAFWPPVSATRVSYGLGLLLAFDVSLGFNGFTYHVLYDYALPFRGLRIPARMGLMVGFTLAVLAGFGAARIAERLPSITGRRAVMAGFAFLILAEYASKPIDLQILPLAPPEVYADVIKDRGDSPTTTLFEFPARPQDDPTYMYFSTFHWQHLVNGYSGFFPPSYHYLGLSLENFPDDESMRAIKARGARYLVIHGERLYGDHYETLVADLVHRREVTLLSRRPWQREGQHGEISVYRVSYEESN
ncbi:MAG: hypothetical protein HY655_04230 [Acidobacteria bacterium]|nr:hypothetical protein [Acidobacteriota bacterium]